MERGRRGGRERSVCLGGMLTQVLRRVGGGGDFVALDSCMSYWYSVAGVQDRLHYLYFFGVLFKFLELLCQQLSHLSRMCTILLKEFFFRTSNNDTDAGPPLLRFCFFVLFCQVSFSAFSRNILSFFCIDKSPKCPPWVIRVSFDVWPNPLYCKYRRRQSSTLKKL